MSIEPPEWYRNFHPEAWDEPDAQEQSMMDGCRGFGEWPDYLHDHHARRRWHEAQYAYRQTHPALAEQEFQALVNGELEARRRERGSGPVV